jgi:hypothetical protein
MIALESLRRPQHTQLGEDVVEDARRDAVQVLPIHLPVRRVVLDKL